MPIFTAHSFPAGRTFPILFDGRGETGTTENVAAGCGSEEGAVVSDLDKTVQTNRAGALGVSGGAGWGRLSELSLNRLLFRLIWHVIHSSKSFRPIHANIDAEP